MSYSLKCATCDTCISNFEKEEPNFEKNLRDIEQISTLRKYLLQHVDGSEVNEVLQLFEWQLPFCPLCSELVNRIHDFENEIERIRSLINYMVIVLKNKVLETFTSDKGSSKGCEDDKGVKLRSLIAGESDGVQGNDRDPLTNFIVDDIDSLLSEVRTLHERLPEREIKIEIPDLPPSPDQPSINPLVEFTDNDEGLSAQGVTDGSDEDEWNNEVADAEEDSWSNIERKNKKSQNDDNTFGSFASIDRDLSNKSRKRRTDDIPLNRIQQKTTRSPRKVTTNLGNNCFEYDGCKFNKNVDGTYQCGICPDVLKTRDSILTHIKCRHLGMKRVGGRVIPDPRLSQRLSNTNRPLLDITEAVARSYKYRGHEFWEESAAAWKCGSCSKILTTKRIVLGHIKQVHIGLSHNSSSEPLLESYADEDEGLSAQGVTGDSGEDETADPGGDEGWSSGGLKVEESQTDGNTFDSFASTGDTESSDQYQKRGPGHVSDEKQKDKIITRSKKLENNIFEYKGYKFSNADDGLTSKCSTCSGIFKRGHVTTHIKSIHLGLRTPEPRVAPYRPPKEVKTRLMPKELGNNWFDYGGFKLFKQVDGSYQCGTCSVVKSRDTLLRHINKVHLSKNSTPELPDSLLLTKEQSMDKRLPKPKQQLEIEIHDRPSSPQQSRKSPLLDNSADGDQGLSPRRVTPGDSDQEETKDPLDDNWSDCGLKGDEDSQDGANTSDSSSESTDTEFTAKRSKIAPDYIPGYKPPDPLINRVRAKKKLGSNCFEYKGHDFRNVDDGNSQCLTCGALLKRANIVGHIRQVHCGGPKVTEPKQVIKYIPEEKVTIRQYAKRLGNDCFEHDGYMFHKQGDATYKCGVCPDIFKTRNSIVIHIKNIHLQRKTDRQELDVTKLDDNTYAALGHKFREESGTWKCGTCSELFQKKEEILGHLKQKHFGSNPKDRSEPILCPVCGKSFVSRNSYRSHSSIHTGEKNHMCDVCGRTFRLFGVLEVHRRMHEGEGGLRYQCGYENCDKKFLRRNELIFHVRIIHTGERPYVCEICGKSFPSPGGLSTHMLTHAGPEDRKYSCDLCAANFVRKENLKRHKIQVHKMDPKELK